MPPSPAGKPNEKYTASWLMDRGWLQFDLWLSNNWRQRSFLETCPCSTLIRPSLDTSACKLHILGHFPTPSAPYLLPPFGEHEADLAILA